MLNTSTSFTNYRLRKTWEFQDIIKKRKKIFNNQFIIFYSKNQDQEKVIENCRIGISIPQKIVKKAFLRNRYKRQVKSMLIDLMKNNKNFSSRFSKWDFVLLIKENFIKSKFEENKENLKKLLDFFNWRENKKKINFKKNILK
ncbi:MAG: Ribonuclease P protein component [Mycoplasmataceae bacterium]|nr:MAG: Ribonuclease P protein component [Mycoplasmataceae bacterium]